MHDWRSFLWPADEWVVAYSILPLGLTQVQLFSIGHACELYLKAANTKITGDAQCAVQFGHRLKDIRDDCKARAPTFMPTYDILDSVYRLGVNELSSGLAMGKLVGAERDNYVKHRELYVVFRMLPDLKYLGAPMKSVKGPFAIGSMFPSDYWIDYVRSLRSFLGHPDSNHLDALREAAEGDELPQRSRIFLNRILTP
jgi:hypothetical protein